MKRRLTTSLVLTLCLLLVGETVAQSESKKSNAEMTQSKTLQGKPGEQVELSFKTSDGTVIEYLLYLPQEYSTDGAREFPLMYFLHGRGESKGPVSSVAKWGPPRYAQRGDALPYIIVSPQCPQDDWWSSDVQQDRLDELLDSVIAAHRVDSSKMYLTGLSMGGYGSWAMAARHSERFAAVVPICGGGEPEHAEKLKDVSIWAFHGDQDEAVKFEKSVEMVEAIKSVGGTKIRFTSYEHVGHNVWSATYAMPALYKWMDQQGEAKTKRDSEEK